MAHGNEVGGVDGAVDGVLFFGIPLATCCEISERSASVEVELDKDGCAEASIHLMNVVG